MSIRHRIDVAAGRKPADLVLKNARVVSVLADRVLETDVAVADGVIVGFGSYRAKGHIDLRGGYLSSGLIDSHLHIESTLLSPQEFARTVLPRGTTSVIADPHEIANVLGEGGVRWMLKASEGLPLDIYIVLPSCVPASRFESSGHKLGTRELARLAKLPGVIGIGEVMDDPGVIAARQELLAKIRLIPGMRVDGHAPGLTGKELYAYIVAGIHSDHESTKAAEAREKLMAGLHIMIREGTTEKNLKEIAKIVTPANSHRCFFCSDDRSAHDLVTDGHMDDILRRAVAARIPPVTALQMATNNAPYYFRIKSRKGAVAVGYAADLVVFDDLKRFNARMVFKDGRLVARDGELLVPCRSKAGKGRAGQMRVKGLDATRFRMRSRGSSARVRVMRASPRQIATGEEIVAIKTPGRVIESDVDRDILKLAVIERHHGTGRVGLGLVRGFGLRAGALASTICHDAHNLIVVGTSDEDMLAAAKALMRSGGGLAAAAGGKVLDVLPLPIAGLMSNNSAGKTASAYDGLGEIAHDLGTRIPNPFLALSFMGLSVVPELKLTDRGLVDVRARKIVPLIV
jgi:adenine deaminase